MDRDTVEFWRSIPNKGEYTEGPIEDIDTVFYIDGVAFCIQRRRDYNNVIMQRVEPSNADFFDTLSKFRDKCIEKGIIYLRIEGNSRRYKFLTKLNFGDGYNAVQDLGYNHADRNLFYVKLK